MSRKKKIAIIGSGFAGLSGAATLAHEGHEVHVFEKNADLGGRARQFHAEGFTFDMGPSWYWMPDVFEKFFNRFGKSAEDYYQLIKLDPGFQMIFNESETIEIPENYEDLKDLFESMESGAGKKLDKFMEEAEYKYKVGVNDLVYQPGLSLTELMRFDLMKGVFKLQVFTSFSKHVRSYFSNSKLIALMEFPILFLGAMPKNTPALYSLMNYAGLKQGTYYPMGGFAQVIKGMQSLAEELGVQFHKNTPVESMTINNQMAIGLQAKDRFYESDAIIASADYHHVEQNLVPAAFRNYSENYWDSKVFAPSSLLFYLGVNKKISKLKHHNLFFDEDLDEHAQDIYEKKQWPAKPLFYVCCPSKTDDSVAPNDYENLFILMPVSPGIEDREEIRERYFNELVQRIEKYTGEQIIPNIVYKKSYCIKDFKDDYNAYKGNAYGLANTLSQTANLKPSLRNKKIKNLFYAGQLTVPGPGVPPSIISGQVSATELMKYLNKGT